MKTSEELCAQACAIQRQALSLIRTRLEDEPSSIIFNEPILSSRSKDPEAIYIHSIWLDGGSIKVLENSETIELDFSSDIFDLIAILDSLGL